MPFTHRLRPARTVRQSLPFQCLELEDRVTPATFVVDTLLDENSANATTSLREAISQANGNAGPDTINFAPALNNGTITLTSAAVPGVEGLPALTGDTTIANTNPGSLTIARNAAVTDFTIFTINSGVNVTFDRLTITNPQPLLSTSSSTGGVRVVGGNLTVTNGVFTGNISNSDGAAIQIETGTVTVRNSTFSNNKILGIGGSGGAISNGIDAIASFKGTLNIFDSTFSGNQAGIDGGAIGAFNGSTTNITNTTFTSNIADDDGGAINNSNSALTVLNSTFRSNSAGDDGGAIRSLQTTGTATVTITGSTFDANLAANVGRGGAISTGGTTTLNANLFVDNSAAVNGGAVFNNAGNTTTITNSTFSRNRSNAAGKGGGIFNSGLLSVTNTTLFANDSFLEGGGLFNSGSITVDNTIFADNVSTTTTADEISGFVSGRNNIVVDANSAGGLVNNVNGNQVGNISTLGLLSSALSNNGGLTKTHALVAGSFAINTGSAAAASNANLNFDQRGVGFPRNVGGGVDIGAVEFLAAKPTNLIVDTTADNDDNNFSAGNLSLREAILLANANPGADTITFAAGIAGKSIALTRAAFVGEQGLPALIGDTTITAPAAGRVTITRTAGVGDFRLLTISPGATATLNGLIVTNPTPDNAGSGFSGGIFNFGGTLTINNSLMTGNVANGAGAGVFNQDGNLTITRSTFSNNKANGKQGGGGLVVLGSGTVTITGSTFSGNSTTVVGGALRIVDNATISISDSTFNNNSSPNGGGGGVRIEANATANITNSTFSGNSTGTQGGAIVNLGELFLVNSTLTANKATTGGGGLFAGGNETLINTLIAGNFSTGTTPSDIFNTVNSSSNNLVGDASSSGGISNGTTGNIVGVAASTVLSPTLADNGGTTFTHALTAGSKAFRAGTSTNAPTTDQRGFVRPAAPGALPSIGAFEPQNTPPAANNDTATTAFNTAVLVNVLANDTDADGNSLTIASVNEPDSGSSSIFNGQVIYTPNAGFIGTDTFTYTISDGQGGTATANLSVTVNAPLPPPNTPPVAVADTATTAFNTAATVNVLANDTDADGNPLTIASVSKATSGTVAINTGTVRYTPNTGFSGSDSFTYTISDGQGGTATASVNVTVAPNVPPPPANTPPVARNDSATTAFNSPVTVAVLANDTDADGNTLAVTGTASAANGTTTFSATAVVYRPNAGFAGTDAFAYTISDGKGGTATATVSVVVNPVPELLVGAKNFAVGSDAGRAATATMFDATGKVLFTATPFDAGFTGGVRTAAADFNGDGVVDLVMGTGPGRATQVTVLDGKTQAVLFAVDPFEAVFIGGVFVAAGDLTGDGVPELVISPDEGGGPRVRVFNGNGFGQLADFFGIEDTAFRGGARTSVGDITGDGLGDLLVSAGFGGGPRVAVFDGRSLSNGAFTSKPFGDFFAFEPALRNGVFPTIGDLDGDGFAELIAGAGPGGGPRVTAFSGRDLLANTQTVLANFFAGNIENRGGIRVTVKNLDGDNKADLVVGSGTAAGSRVTAYRGVQISSQGTPPAVLDFDAVLGFTGGVFVG